MWLVIKLQMYSCLFFLLSFPPLQFPPQPRPPHPRKKTRKKEKKSMEQENNKECWRGGGESQHWETDLIACVLKAKERRDKLATDGQ